MIDTVINITPSKFHVELESFYFYWYYQKSNLPSKEVIKTT